MTKPLTITIDPGAISPLAVEQLEALAVEASGHLAELLGCDVDADAQLELATLLNEVIRTARRLTWWEAAALARAEDYNGGDDACRMVRYLARQMDERAEALAAAPARIPTIPDKRLAGI